MPVIRSPCGQGSRRVRKREYNIRRERSGLERQRKIAFRRLQRLHDQRMGHAEVSEDNDTVRAREQGLVSSRITGWDRFIDRQLGRNPSSLGLNKQHRSFEYHKNLPLRKH